MDSDDDGPSLGRALAMRKHGEVAAPQHRSSGSKRARDNDSESESEEEGSRQQRRTSSNTARNRNSNESEDESGQEEEKYSGSEAEEIGKSAGKKADRNAPVELRINRPVSRFQHVVQVKKPVRKDPRFESSAGSFNEDMFDKAYGFLEGYRDDEIATLKAELKKNVADPEERQQLKDVLQKLQNQRAQQKQKQVLGKVVHQKNKERREAISAGKSAYYPKQRELRELAAVERFKGLEAKGDAALDKALAKKRKRLAGKDRKKLPWQKRDNMGAGAGAGGR